MSESRRILRRDVLPRGGATPTGTVKPTGSAPSTGAGGTATKPQPATSAKPVPAEAVASDRAAPARRLGRWVLAAMLLVALTYEGQLRRPIGPSAGALDVRITASRVDPLRSARVKLGTYNIHGGRGTDRRFDLDRIADLIRGLDFVGLNEVYGPALWQREDQAVVLGRKLRMTPLFAPTEERWWHYRFGNGLLTRLDVESRLVVPLERRYGKSYRNLVHVRLRAPNGAPVHVVVTHIDRSDDRERREQLRTVADYFLSLAPPAVLMGDLNSDASEREIQRLIEAPDVVDPLGVKLGLKTPRRIDWILARGVEPIDAGLTPVGPSDHPHVWAELSVPPAP